eukprot:TRINITY_DN1656_c0_g1_i1.p1 TRINITY_DN1656_c0_g1~~TRINITY_DN1656_c0_g1_i1.p1  ORF type:complete len:206 (+),score=33.00 TRINITY_DN1656_c0_g1_i1:52-669(+)
MCDKTCCTLHNWGVFCQWGGAIACLFFIVVNIIVIAEYSSDMDTVTIILRCFSMLFCLAIALMSISCLRKWAKSFLACAWFLSNWGTRGFFLIYLGVVAASSYGFDGDKKKDCGKYLAPDDHIEDWVDITRYVCGGLFVFFGILYAMLSCCGGGKDEEAIEQPEWGNKYSDSKKDAPSTGGDIELGTKGGAPAQNQNDANNFGQI